MRPLNPRSRVWRLAALALATLAAACVSPSHARRTGLFTSLPILWQDTGNLGDLLDSDTPPHWALTLLQQQGEVRAIDSFLPGSKSAPFRGIDRLVMAQPRPLAPEENVALDNWVRGGGRLLLFADPLLTAHSAFAIGDRRRHEDIAMLSPILARWGLRLEFDEDQPGGVRDVRLMGVDVPVHLPGKFAATGSVNLCELLADGLAAQCRIGKGRALILADAALFEPASQEDLQKRRTALQWMLAALDES